MISWQRATPRDEGPSIRRHLVGGAIVALMLTGGLGGWAATTELVGRGDRVRASVVVDSNVKKVQHPTGGIVGELLVRDGERVQAPATSWSGSTRPVTRANLAIVAKGLDELNARQARLESGTRRRRDLRFPRRCSRAQHDPDVARAI